MTKLGEFYPRTLLLSFAEGCQSLGHDNDNLEHPVGTNNFIFTLLLLLFLCPLSRFRNMESSTSFDFFQDLGGKYP